MERAQIHSDKQGGSVRKNRTATELSQSLNKRLIGYGLAAGAVGVGMLATAPPSLADIIFTPANTVVPVNGSLDLDLDHNGTVDFTLFNGAVIASFPSQITGETHAMSIKPGPGNSVLFSTRGTFTHGYGAARLPKGARIGPGGQFVHSQTRYGGHALAGLMGRAATWTFQGPWAGGGAGYLGLRFQIDGQVHYGWASLITLQAFVPPNQWYQERLTGYAYDTVPNEAIKAGQGAPTPEPGTLGLLALGSLGLGFWRRKKQEAVTSDK